MTSRPTNKQVEDARYRSLADPNRRLILRFLEDANEPLDVATLAQGVGLHVNTVRGHLELMLQGGLISREPESRTIRGRPRLLYSPVPQTEDSTPTSYRLLAEVLTTSLRAQTENPEEAAEKAGREWGLYLTGRRSPAERPDFDESMAEIMSTLDELGFEPETASQGEQTAIDLRGCPFRELAKEHPDVVCRIHLGLLRGSAEALGNAVVVNSLEPFISPTTCRTTISPA